MDDARYGGVRVDLLPWLIEENLQQFYRFLTQHTSCSQPSLHGIRWMRPENSTWPNLIYSADLNPDSLESDLAQIIAGIRENAIPPVWLMGPLTRPVGLPQALEAHGFLPGMQWSGMALALDELEVMQSGIEFTQDKMELVQEKRRLVPDGGGWKQDSLAPGGNTEMASCYENLTIEVVDNSHALGEWLTVVQNGLLPNSQIDLEYFANLLGLPEVKFYLGRVGGKPVGSSLLFLTPQLQQSAGLYLIAVLPEHRGQGIGRLMTLCPLIDARQCGCQLAVLQATQLGERVYRRIGFREFCQFRFYKYQS